MRRLLIRLLNALGLVTAGHHQRVAAQLRDAQAAVKKQLTLVEEVRAESRSWKLKADEAIREVKALRADLVRQTQRADKLAADVATHTDRARTWTVELEALQKRLAEAERELIVAREHLMAVDVKLDILEGAATVLDLRTRTVATQHAGKTGVPV